MDFSQLLNIALLVLSFSLLIFFGVIYPHIKFRDKSYAKNKELLSLDYERARTAVQQYEMIACTFIIAGLVALGAKDILFDVGATLVILGLIFIFLALLHFGSAERVYNTLRDLTKKSK